MNVFLFWVFSVKIMIWFSLSWPIDNLFFLVYACRWGRSTCSFGALLEHYHDKICKIANDGNILWAIAILGFGRLEKLTVVYNELLWAKLLRDFTVEVVREPVHIVGNSIGGTFFFTTLLVSSSFPIHLLWNWTDISYFMALFAVSYLRAVMLLFASGYHSCWCLAHIG